MTAGAMTRMMAVMGLAAALASLPATTRAQEDGCPCLTEFPQELRESDLYNEAENCLYYEVGGVRHCYSLTYGLAQCAAHDEGLDPFCSALFPPDFCERGFCFVDSSCKSEPYASSHFPGYGLYYSYKTCGSINSFVPWNGDSSRGMSDLVGLLESYAWSAKQALQANVQTVRDLVESGSTEGCQLDPSCEGCSSCEMNDCWQQEINTRATNVVLHPNLEAVATEDEITELSCMTGFISSTYQRTAAKEYNDEGRIAYQYFGSQSTGAMVQWPASNFCDSTFDARQRPWYASAASGSKNIYIIIAVSGSRVELAKAAAKAVLRTLTWVDGANILLFKGDGKAIYHPFFASATEANVADMASWIDANLEASGLSDFDSALRNAHFVMRASSGCKKTILFLTDGSDYNGFDDAVLDDLSSSDVVIFSYALGSGASEAPLKTMACATGGIFYPVDSESALPDIMTSYYEYFVQLTDPCSVNWVKYSDAITGAEILAVCSAVFDTTADATVLQGVNCIDLNLVVDMTQIRTCGYQAYRYFTDALREEAARCGPASSVSGCALAKLRAKVGSSSVCSGDVPLYTCGNTNIAFSATSCEPPDTDRFELIPLSCQTYFKSCGKVEGAWPDNESDEDGSAKSNIPAIAGGISGGLLIVLVAMIAYSRAKRRKGSPDMVLRTTRVVRAFPATLGFLTTSDPELPVARIIEVSDANDLVDAK